MQTRVAVRDKTPHRFQVIPLCEVKKSPLDTTLVDSLPPSPMMCDHSSRKHPTLILDSGNNNKTRSLGRIPGRPPLRKKDVNSYLFDCITSDGDHSLSAMAGVSQTPKSRNLPIHSTRSQAASPPLNQYSFRLKPWKSFAQMRSAASTDVFGHTRSHDNDLETPTPFRPLSCGDKSDNTLSPRSDGSLSDLSKTLNDLDCSDPFMLPQSTSPELNKRHAIYSCLSILSPGQVPFSDVGASPADWDQVFPVPALSGDLDWLNSLSVPLTGPGLGLILPPILPLKFNLRTSVVPFKRAEPKTMHHPSIIEELLRELDETLMFFLKDGQGCT